MTTSGPANANPFQYTGRENDGTGLYYYRARYYSPIYQRFISEDPSGFAGSGVNFYAYAGDNPVDFSDPFGLKPNRCQAFYCGPWPWPFGGENGGGNSRPGQQPKRAPNPNLPQPHPKQPNPNKPPCQDPATEQQQAEAALKATVVTAGTLPLGAPVTTPQGAADALGTAWTAKGGTDYVNAIRNMFDAIAHAVGCASQ